MILVNLQIKVKQGLETEYLEAIDKLLPDTRSFEGCHAVYNGVNHTGSGDFEIISKWDSKQQYDKYLDWRKETGVLDDFGRFFDSEPVWRFIDLKSEF